MSKQLLFHAVFGLMLLFLPLSHKIYLLLKYLFGRAGICHYS